MAPRYLNFGRKIFSLGVIDTAVAYLGTEDTLVWGEEGESPNPEDQGAHPD